MQTDVIKPSSCVRRKPSTTYKSPTATEWTTYAPCPSLHPKSSSQTPTPPPSRANRSSRPVKKLPNRPRRFAPQLLPLYHPHGQLACSLPPLDPLSFGLEAPIINYTEPEASRPSSRARRRSPGPAPIDSHQPPIPIAISTVSAVAAVAAREIREKEKPSPRKRRTGGGGGGGKRKRKDHDSSDATYPAKRTRAPRNTTAPPVIEEESPNEMEANGPEDEGEHDAENEMLVERRTTRSRAGLQRQSSVNTTTSEPHSKSVSPGAPDAPEGPTAHHDIEMKTPTPESDHIETPTNQEPLPMMANMKGVQMEEKEEGELSDDGR